MEKRGNRCTLLVEQWATGLTTCFHLFPCRVEWAYCPHEHNNPTTDALRSHHHDLFPTTNYQLPLFPYYSLAIQLPPLRRSCALDYNYSTTTTNIDMPLNVEIVPSDHVLHMFGPQETDCAYSLSGQVLLSVLPSRSAFHKEMKPQPALLTSLVLTFEGASEHFAKGQGYTATRLCSVSQSLVVRTTPVAIPSTPDHKIAIIFDLAIPGWLPASLHSKHATTATTRYTLHAKAIYQSEESSALWLGSKTKYRDAKPVEVTVRRHRTTSAPKRCTYAVPSPRTISPTQTSVLPKEVKAAIQARATIPNYVDAAQERESSFDLRLDLGCSVPGVTVHKFGVRFIQSTTYGTTPDADFKRVFPLPAQQPPTVPLLTNHELDSLYMAGVTFPSNALRVDKDDVLHPDRPSVFNMQEGEEGHALDSEPSSITVPLYLDSALVKPSYVSPYVHIVHRLFVDLDIRYRDQHERVGFFLPLPVYDGPLLSRADDSAPRPNDGLPAYVQLYHSNGEAKYVADLPAYSKECGPGEIRDESEGGCHPVEFRRKHVRRTGLGGSSSSSSSRSSSSRSSTDSCSDSSSAGSDAGLSSGEEESV